MLITRSQNEPSHQPSHRIGVELRSTHQANHAGADIEGMVSF